MTDTPSLQDVKNASLGSVQAAKELSLQGLDPSLALSAPTDNFASEYAKDVQASNEDATNDINSQETLGSSIGNLGLGAAQAVTNTIGSIGSFGLGLANAKAGTYANDATNAVSDYLDSMKSSELHLDEQNVEKEKEEAQKGIDAKFNSDMASSKGIVDSIAAYGRKFASEAVQDVKIYAQHPDAASDIVGQGIGSIAAFGGGMKALSIGTKGVLALGDAMGLGASTAVKGIKAAAEVDKATQSLSAARAISSVMDHTPITAVGAAMEGGGAYQGATTDVMNMKDEDLAKSAPDYAQILASVNGDKDAAKRIIANKAGLIAGAIAAPTGALTSHIAGKFEADPLKGVTARTAATNIAKEGTEEAIQGVTGQLGQNVGVKSSADPSRDLDKDLVDQAVQGAIGGIGSAAPASGIGVSRAALGKLADKVKTNIQNNIANNQTANEDVSPTSDKNLNDTISKVKEAAPETQTQINDSIDELPETDMSVEKKENLKSSISDLINAATENPADYVQDDDPKEIKDAFTSATNAVGVVRNLVKIHADESVDPEVRNAALGLSEEVRQGIHDKVTAVTPEDVAQLPDHIKGFVEDYLTLGDTVSGAINVATSNMDDTQKSLAQKAFGTSDEGVSNPVDIIKLALTGDQNTTNSADLVPALSSMSKEQADQIKADPALGSKLDDLVNTVNSDTGSNISANGYDASDATPEQKQASVAVAQKNAKMIENSPEQATPSILDQIAYHEANGDLKLTDRQQTAIKAAKAITDSMQETSKQMVGSKDPKAIVSSEISYVDGQKGLSALTYARDIYRAYRSGDLDLAKSRMSALKNFAMSQNNKVAAINQHYQEGSDKAESGKIYQTVNHYTQEIVPSSLKAWVNAKAPKSIEAAQNFSDEATGLTNLYNSLAEAFPEISEGKQKSTKLVSQLVGKPEEIAQSHKEGKVDRNQVSEAKAEVEPTSVVEEPQPKAEAEVAPEVEEPVKVQNEKVEEKKRELKEEYPSLVPNSLFHAGFEPTETTKIASEAQPIEAMQEALSDPERLTEVVSADRLIQKRMSDEVRQAYSGLLSVGQGILYSMNEALHAYSQNEFKTKAGKQTTNLNETLTDPKHLRKTQNKVLNFTRLVKDAANGDHLEYDPKAAQLAIMAGLNWIVKTPTTDRNLDEDRVSKSLGFSPKVVISDDLVMAFNDGIDQQAIVNDISQSIMRFMGIKPNKNVPNGLSEGLVQAMAIQVVDGLQKAGMLEDRGVTYYDQNGDVIPQAQAFTQNKKGKSAVLKEGVNFFKRFKINPEVGKQAYKSYASFLEEALAAHPEAEFHFDQATLPEPKSLSANPLVSLNANQKAAAKAAMSVPHLPNMPMIRLYYALGRNALLDVFGGQSDLSGKINQNDLKAIQGKNMSIAGAFDLMDQMMKEAKNYADAKGVSVEELPHYFAMNYSSVNRLMYSGTYTPQSNKLLREALMTTWHGYDLSNANSKDMNSWLLGIGQMLGLKIHNMTDAQSITEVSKVLNDPQTKRILDILQGFHKDPKAIKSSDRMVIQNFMNDRGYGFAGMNALSEYARYLGSDEAGKANFRSPIYVEADGMSNGSANAMAGFANGERTSAWEDNMKSVGVFFNEEMDNNTFRQNASSQDLYQKTAGVFIAHHQAFVSELADDVGRLAKDTMKVLAAFNKDYGVDFDGNLIDATRNAIKNPQTQVVYSASPAGIAGTISRNIIKEFYKLATTYATNKAANPNASMAQAMFPNDEPATANQKIKDLRATLNSVMNQRVVKTRLGYSIDNVQSRDLLLALRSDPINFKIEPNEFTTLTRNLTNLVTGSLHSAVTETMTPTVTDTLDLLQESMQLKSIIAADAFKGAMDKLIAEKKANSDWMPSDGFTQKEVMDAYNQIKPMLAMVRTNAGTFSFGDAIRTNPFSYNVSSATNFSGGLSSPLTVRGFKSAGNSPKPNFVIGTGDGMAILRAFSDPNMPKGVTQIWDGVHFPAINAQEGGQYMNQKVLESWQQNNMADVAKSYQAMLSMMEKTGYTPSVETLKTISEDMLGRIRGIKAEFSPEAVMAYIQQVGKDLEQNAALGAERADMFKTQKVSVNNMSSVEGTNYVSNSGKETPVEVTPSKTKVVSLDMNGVFNTLRQHTSQFSDGQKAVLKELARSSILKNWKVMIGNQADLNQQSTQDIGRTIFSSPNQKGAVHVGSQTIYLTTSDAETVIHELIHAATLEAVHGVYARSAMGKNRQYAHQAVKYIEGLMKTVVDTNPEFLQSATPELRKSYNNMVNQIEQIRSQKMPIAQKRALVMNEFMAWSLSNKDLINAYTQTPTNPIFRVADKVIRAIKRIVFGGNELPKEGNDMFTNLLFGSAVLMNSQPRTSDKLRETAAYMSTGYGSNQRLADIQRYFNQSLTDHFDQPVSQGVGRADQATYARLLSNESLVQLQAAGFNLTPQQVATFQSITNIMGTAADINSAFTARAQELMNEAQKHISMKDFMVGSDLTDTSDTTQATQKYDALFSRNNLRTDAYGRSSVLPTFIAMAIVDDNLRAKLATIKSPTSVNKEDGTLDTTINNFALSASDLLGHLLTGESKNSSVKKSLDDMISAMVQSSHNAEDLFNRVTGPVGDVINTANQFLVDNIKKMGEAVATTGAKVKDNTQNKGVKAIAAWAEVIGKVIASDGEAVSKGLTKMGANVNSDVIRNLITEIVGRTSDNAVVVDLIQKWVNANQQMRQKSREEIPSIIMKKFSRKLTDAEWTHITNLSKTDVAGLYGMGRSMDDVMKLVTSSSDRANEIQSLEKDLQNHYGARYQYLNNKVNDLVTFMNTGKASEDLLTNANAIADLLNKSGRLEASDEATIKKVDDLITLRAIENLHINSKNAVNALIGSQKDGMSFYLHYLVGQRATEMEKVANSDAGFYNHYKGYFHKEQGQGHSLIVALDDTDGKELLNKSYVRVGDYKGSNKESGAGSRGYYYAPVNGKTVFNQGVFQHIKETASGVSASSGFTSGSKTAGVIINPAEVRAIKESTRVGSSNGEALRPIFARDGKIFAYERMVNPDQLEKLDYDTHAARMIGAWRGRQLEEQQAGSINKGFIDALHQMYEEDVRHNNNPEDYINLYADTDPVIKDALKLFSKDLKDHINDVFGSEFMVHKNLKEQVTGYHRASIGDAWTGNSRWSPSTQKMVRDAATAVMGNKAYQYLTTAERFIQDRVADAKVTIVVKSIVVAAKNLKDNILQLVTRGVNPVDIAVGMVRKTNELNKYVKGRQREIEAEAELRASVNPNLSAKLRTEIQSIRDGYKRLSIWPLLEDGQFAGISGEGLRREDLELANGRWDNFFETMANKLPDDIKTAGRYLVIAKDTPLFQGLQKAVEYGDFLSKAVYYDHLIRKNVSSKEALAKIAQEYVNYALAQGRLSDYADSMGLQWFWKTKVRLAKVAVSIIKDNPLQCLMMGMADQSQMFGNIDTPLSSNIFTQLADGRITNSIGLGQLFRAPMMNPIVQILH